MQEQMNNNESRDMESLTMIQEGILEINTL